MNFQQLRAVREAVRRRFNLTDVATVLHTSQPGVSRQIRELEDELGLEIFVRVGKRLTGLTPAGERVVPWVEKLLLDADNLHHASQDFLRGDSGTLSIGAVDAASLPTDWNMAISFAVSNLTGRQLTVDFLTSTASDSVSGGYEGFSSYSGASTGTPGQWSVSVVPEPAMASLLIAGLALVGATTRKRAAVG